MGDLSSDLLFLWFRPNFAQINGIIDSRGRVVRGLDPKSLIYA